MNKLLRTLLALSILAAGANAYAWPSDGTRVYYNSPMVSERCLVPLRLFRERESPNLQCEEYPAQSIFRFNEALAGTRVELIFKGKSVTGNWTTDNRSVGNDFVHEVILGGETFVTRIDSGGKLDSGQIQGQIKCGVIYARANSEGFEPDAGYVDITIRQISDGILWRASPKVSKTPGYMPWNEELHLNRDSFVEKMETPDIPVKGVCGRNSGLASSRKR